MAGTSPAMTAEGWALHKAKRLGQTIRMSERGGWVYMMTNKPNGTLYLGVTSDLTRRVYQHRTGETQGFTRRYGLRRLVWCEHYPDIRDAIQSETSMKRWPRAWKVRTLMTTNPDWADLYETLA